MDYLSSIKNGQLTGKTILLRIDCDVDLKEEDGGLVVDEDYRLKCVLPTINFLIDRGVLKIIIIGHIGRPDGRVVKELELEPVASWFSKSLNSKSEYRNPKQIQKIKFKIQNQDNYQINEKIWLLENVRFDEREEENDGEFAKGLASLGDIYVNEAFGVSHRAHVSIAGLPKYLPSFYGLQFEKEIERLTWLKKETPRPLVFVLGGSKADKLEYLEFLGKWADELLIGGKLPQLIESTKSEYRNPKQIQNSKLQIPGNELLDKQNNVRSIEISQYPSIKLATLTPNGLDIDQESIELFKAEIARAKTVVWAGPMGKYEEKGNETGTYAIAKAIVASKAIKFAGGGDTHRIISRLNLWDKFDFVSVGGGAMLRYLMSINMGINTHNKMVISGLSDNN